MNCSVAEVSIKATILKNENQLDKDLQKKEKNRNYLGNLQRLAIIFNHLLVFFF
jgi:hypothetical protein